MPITYTGAPVVSTVVFFGALDAYSIDGAWSEGTVNVDRDDKCHFRLTSIRTRTPSLLSPNVVRRRRKTKDGPACFVRRPSGLAGYQVKKCYKH